MSSKTWHLSAQTYKKWVKATQVNKNSKHKRRKVNCVIVMITLYLVSSVLKSISTALIAELVNVSSLMKTTVTTAYCF